MKYHAPFGQPDPDAPFINGNPGAGIEGSIPPAAAIEHPQREIVAAIVGAGLTPDDGDLTQLWQAISGIRSRLVAFTSTGATNWTVPDGVHRVFVQVWGGGGGGGGVGTGGGGAAGGTGAQHRAGFVDVTPGNVITVTVGTGGPGGNGTPSSGSNGGSSSFGSAITAVGGRGGSGASGGGTVSGASPLTGGGGGSLTIPGAGTAPGLTIGGTTVGSAGGGSFCGASVVAISTSLGNGSSYPGGGGGGAGGNVNQDGAAGANGLVIVTY